MPLAATTVPGAPLPGVSVSVGLSVISLYDADTAALLESPSAASVYVPVTALDASGSAMPWPATSPDAEAVTACTPNATFFGDFSVNDTVSPGAKPPPEATVTRCAWPAAPTVDASDRCGAYEMRYGTFTFVAPCCA